MTQPASFSWQGIKVLIADDEPDMREIFAAWLRNVGCTVTEVSDGQEALDALDHETFDAVVTDVRMPRLTGIELVHRLHKADSYIPVIIFVSGFVDMELSDAFDLGVECVLSKPCPRPELIEALRRSMQRRNLIFEPPPGVHEPDPEKQIEQSFPSLENSPAALGRGGISLELKKHINPEETIGFALDFSQGTVQSLHGWGLVRWCEAANGKIRAGIEFMELDRDSLASFASWLREQNPPSFIPKSSQVHEATRASP